MSNGLPKPGNSSSLSRYAALEYVLLGDLRDLLEEKPDRLTRKWLIAVLDALLETLPSEFALQEDGGYMADVLETFPNWSGYVADLQQERERLYNNLKQLRDQVARDESYDQLSSDLQKNLRNWMLGIAAFHRHERRLIQSAYNLEVGVGD
ncbi:MAG: hypothetical protein Tsb009_05770 [Planctomycetaceae bacterium]